MTKAIVDLIVSANGMIARENGDEDWLPEDGWGEFLQQVQKYQNVIIGRETYEQVAEKYEHDNFDEIHGVLKIIVTRNRNYTAPNAEYSVVYSPEEAIKLVAEKGLEDAYVCGGGELTGSFLRSNLVSRLRLTILPKIIARGRLFTGNSEFADIEMELADMATVNDVITLDYNVVSSRK